MKQISEIIEFHSNRGLYQEEHSEFMAWFICNQDCSFNVYKAECKKRGICNMSFEAFVRYGFGVTNCVTPYFPPYEDLVLQS